MSYLHRFQTRILPHTNSKSVQGVHAFSHPGSVLPLQSSTLWSVHSTHGVHSSGERGQIAGIAEGYKDPPVPRRLVASQQGKIRPGPQTGFDFVGYQFDLKEGKVRPTVADPNNKDSNITDQSGLSGPANHAFIGLLTATEKQVH